MTEILPDEHQPPNYKTGEGDQLHQTVYGQSGLEQNIYPSPHPEHIDLTTPDSLANQIETTQPQNPPIEITMDEPTAEPETSQSPELEDNEIEELVSMFEKLEAAFRAASETDKTLGDQIRITLSKIQDRIRTANPNEAGFAPIKRSVDSLTSSLTQNQFYRSLIEGDGNHIPIPSFKDELRQTLARLKSSEDPAERLKLATEAQALVTNQITKAEELIQKQKANDAEKKAILVIIERAEREAVEKERQIIQVVNDGQPLPPESISAIYSTLAKELADQTRTGINTSKNSETLLPLGNSILEKLINVTNKNTKTAEAPNTSPNNITESEGDTEEGGISAKQREVIDRAFSDPDSRDRLQTIVETFGSKQVREYFKSKIENSSPQENPNHS